MDEASRSSAHSKEETSTDSQEDSMPKSDPFGNFSFTNYATLTQVAVRTYLCFDFEHMGASQVHNRKTNVA